MLIFVYLLTLFAALHLFFLCPTFKSVCIPGKYYQHKFGSTKEIATIYLKHNVHCPTLIGCSLEQKIYKKRNKKQMNISEWAESWKGIKKKKVVPMGRGNLRTVPRKSVQVWREL